MVRPAAQTATQKLIVAIDGPAGAGKSTVAIMLAERLGLPYLDTGAMYRAVGLLAKRAGLSLPLDVRDETTIESLATGHTIVVEPDGSGTRVLIDGEDVSDEIRSPECSMMASAVSALSGVRRALVPQQRTLGLVSGGVMEGRDIGSVVFPDATAKIFLTASAEERALRRYRDLETRRTDTSLEVVREEQRQRDRQDTSRADSPLQVARGSVVIDTTGMTLEEVVERVLDEVERKIIDDA